MRLRVALATLLILATRPALAQVVELPHATVEFIGLRTWTIPMIRDSLAAKSPGTPLDRCAVVLRRELGFPNAAVKHFMEPGKKPYAVITVVEPGDSNRVQFRSLPFGRGPVMQEWEVAGEVLETHRRAFEAGLASYPEARHGEFEHAFRSVRVPPEDSAAVVRFWEFLRDHSGPADRELALRTLASDSTTRNRMVAAALLINFPESDPVWWALMGALTDPVGSVGSVAGDVMAAMSQHSPRAIDWRPAAESIRYVLSGTNLFELDTAMQVLTRTEISPDLAPLVLAGGGDLLLDYMQASRSYERDRAHALLVQLRGEDLGSTPAGWKSWLQGL